ncbi:hypothetical protein [Actinocorallia lasiicapitis]
MGAKAERRAAFEAVAAYHESCLGELVARVAEVVDRHRAGEVDAFEVDQVIHGYTKAARKLWSFCQVSGGTVEATALAIARASQDGEPIDWWPQR